MNSKSLIVIIYFLIIFDPQIYGFMYLLYNDVKKEFTVTDIYGLDFTGI